jgi:hypothetical protein
MYRIILLLLVCSFLSCKKDTTELSDKLESVQDSLVLSKVDIQKINFTEFVLDSKSENQLNWLKYIEMDSKVEELKNGDFSHFKTDKKIVETLMDEFTNTLPLHLNEESIQARILIVKTMYLKLNNIINMSTSTEDETKKAIQDFLISFSNLNYQINKKFERDSQNVTKPR